MAPQIVQFSPLPSLISPSFWHQLTELKLDVLKLSDAEVEITGTYGVGRLFKDRESTTEKWVGVGGSLTVDELSFASGHPSLPFGSSIATGVVKNYNTIEEFKAAEKVKLLNEAADKAIFHPSISSEGSELTQMWLSIQTTRSTLLLNSFILITYADLKKYKYFYWFGFPAFVSKPSWYIDGEVGWTSASSNNAYTSEQLKTQSNGETNIAPVEEFDEAKDAFESTTIAFIDPSAESQNPGWPLRNLLAYLNALHPAASKKFRVLCWRDSEVPRDDGWKSRFGVVTLGDGTSEVEIKSSRPDVTGWEKNVQGKLGPRVADLAPMMDPARLANQAVDLNLKLMRWRIIPALDLDKIAATKCLLLGAGTLGCYVARCLMGWGVRKITLVDSAKVSFSNPVRQPLFQFSDCLNGGRPKAECAAERLKEVWPGLDATGVSLSIPMPGHPIPQSPPSILEQTKKDVEKLEQLIEEHDAVYLLMDSRESRWLPTVIGRAKGKLVLNAALGFDTFLVMRHGARPDATTPREPEDPKAPRRNLGCYYCNDIVAPADSLSDRTLDQMCTVTRPGLASIAASTAVELMMSVLQHPDGVRAPAPPAQANPNEYPADGEGTSVLGMIPHQLRGYLAQFRNLPIVGAAYDKCTGCSETVLKTYEKEGFDMMLNAFNDPKYLEQLTGLDKLYDDSEKALENVDWIEGEEEDDF
ncbi:Autophagy protein 7 [Marasmius crinis-equi]|uniref:Ubiquitin-like modifier-activating enzyme ATG7 n=1 Tax=Marasmius crinis-equi TaxID=585013 RepID=A0ABR3EYM1_9AGAR